MTAELARTPLYDWHAANGAKLVDFAGWAMPVHYGSIISEHEATRQRVGLFDISHMGRLRFEGPRAADFLDGLVTRRIQSLKSGRIRYALVTNDSGGILDDVLVYRLRELNGDDIYTMVVNASNRDKIVQWIRSRPESVDVTFQDETLKTAMIAVQGPLALEIVQPLCNVPLSEMPYYTGNVITVNQQRVVVSRTGYTGEDGVELIVPAKNAVDVWDVLVQSAQARQGLVVGLGARDTLRLEAAMPLYGHELTETINPYQAGLSFAVDLKDRQFPGRDALVVASQDRDLPRRIGLSLEGKRVPREHYAIRADGDKVGEITSGTFSPTLQRPIAMGYVQPQFAQEGMQLQIDVRGRDVPAEVVKLPFYQRSRD